MNDYVATKRPNPWQIDKIQSFIGTGSAFRHLTKPFLALVSLRTDDADVVVSARLTFASPTAELVAKQFESQSIRAIACPLPDHATADEVLSAFATGSVSVDDQTFLFPTEAGSEIRVELEVFHQGAGAQTRLSVLTMHGRTTGGLLDSQRLDWEVKAASPPYLTFQELLLDFGVPVPQGFGIFETFHVIPIAIDSERSHLRDNVASVSVKVERGIPPGDVELGLVAIKAGETAHRQTIRGAALAWEDNGRFLIGSVQCETPPGRAVQAVASLRGTAFHYWWLVDPQHVINPRKGIFETIDPGLTRLHEFVSHPSKGAAREFEAGVAWLFWMLGFSVAHLGPGKFAQDAVDVLVATPAGNFALVECTTGVISTDRKVPNLLRRRALVLEMLARSNHNAVRVLPIIVTSCGREEVEQEIAPAQERGVLVLTKSDLEEMLNHANTMLDPDEVYRLAEEQLGAAATVNPYLPGIS